jgi:processing peptidase subunit beta
MGATFNVTSAREHTAYTLSLMKGDLKQGVEILADCVTSPGLGNLKAEIGSITRNLDQLDRPTRAVIDDRLHACAFRDSSLGNTSIGPYENIESINEDSLKKFVVGNYTADRIVLAASGAFSHKSLVDLASSLLGGLTAGTPQIGTQKPYFCGADLLYRNDEMGPTAYVSVGWEGVPHRSPDAVTFMVMAQCIGSYAKGRGLVPGTISGNRTINNVANKMGVGCANEFEAFSLNYKDTGLFGFFAACDEVAVEHCIGELMFGMNLLSFSITEEEVARAKRELKAKLCADDSAASACAEIGHQVLAYGRGVPLAEMMIRIDAIDAEEVKRVAWKYLNDAEISATALGPIHGHPQYMDLRRMTTMHRY